MASSHRLGRGRRFRMPAVTPPRPSRQLKFEYFKRVPFKSMVEGFKEWSWIEDLWTNKRMNGYKWIERDMSKIKGWMTDDLNRPSTFRGTWTRHRADNNEVWLFCCSSAVLHEKKILFLDIGHHQPQSEFGWKKKYNYWSLIYSRFAWSTLANWGHVKVIQGHPV